MAGKKGKAREMGENQTPSLGGTILRMVAVGLVGGIALIAGAKKVGDTLLESESQDQDAALEDKEESEGGSN